MNTLSLFNQQVIICQDDAFTLAWYLLGDEAQAEAAMQGAVESAFRCFSADQANCRLSILKQVVKQCRGQKPTACCPAEPAIFSALHLLDRQEREVLVLIDVLRSGYPEAAYIINRPLTDIGPLLCQARRRLTMLREQ